jgi:hypothetical protein
MLQPFNGANGTTYTFDHMEPFSGDVSVTINGSRYLIPVSVIFSSHCYTDGKNGAVKTTDDDYLLTDASGHRALCPTRYKVSKDLPSQIRSIFDNAHVPQCYTLNAASGYIFLHDSDHPNKWRGWYVFFTFDRSKHGAPLALRVSVTSHHYRQTHPQNLRWKGVKKFPVLVSDWMRDRPDFVSLFTPLEDEIAPVAAALVEEIREGAKAVDAMHQEVAALEMEKPA